MVDLAPISAEWHQIGTICLLIGVAAGIAFIPVQMWIIEKTSWFTRIKFSEPALKIVARSMACLLVGAGILTLCYALAPKPADYMQTIGDSYGISQLKIDVTGLRNITEDGRYDASWVKDGKPGDGYASVKNQKVTLLDSTGQQMEANDENRQYPPVRFRHAGRERDGRQRRGGRGRRTGPHPFGRGPAPAGAVLMGGYWWGVLTPFAIVLGILLLWLAGSLFGAIVSWAWKKAHYGLLKKGWIAEDYDEDSREWTTRPGAERLAAALTRSGEYRMLPCFGWMILIVRDHKNEKHDEKRN